MLFQVMIFPLAIVYLVRVVQSSVIVKTVWRRAYISACSSSAVSASQFPLADVLYLTAQLTQIHTPTDTPETPPISVIRYGPRKWLQTGGPPEASGLRGLRRTGQLRR